MWVTGAPNVTVVKFVTAKWARPGHGIRRAEDVSCAGFHEESW